MADPLAQARHDLAVANRVVAYEGIIDAFQAPAQHATPDQIGRPLSDLALALARGGQEAADIYEFHAR